MTAIVVRNLPPSVHDALRRLAKAKHQPVEALVREALTELAEKSRGGIDFEKLARRRAELGLHEDGPEWTPAMDDPALSWKVLGLPMPKPRAKRKK